MKVESEPCTRVRGWVRASVLVIALVIAVFFLLRDPARDPGPSGPNRSTGSPASGVDKTEPPSPPRLESPNEDPDRRSEIAAPESEATEPRAPSDLRVLTLDSSGLPVAGVPVEFLLQDRLRRDLVTSLAAGVSSAPEGIAVLTGSARALSRLFTDAALGALEGRVRCTLPLDDPLEASVQQENAAGEPVRLTLPAVGWVQVTIRPRSPQGVPAVQRIVWRRVLENGVSPQFEVAGSSARIGPLGLGWTLNLEARSAGRADPVGALTLDGPVHPGEVLAATIETTSSLRIEGVAIDVEGKPFADVNMIAKIGLANRALDTYARTDADGRFAVEVEAGEALEYLELRRCDIPEPAPRGRFDLPGQPPDPFAVDIGRVELRLPESEPRSRVLAGGIVVDEQGLPLDRALVVALTRPGERESAVASFRTEDDGLFRLVGAVQPEIGQLEVFAEKTGFMEGARALYPIGREDLRLVLARGGALAGSVLVSDWVPRDLVSLELHGGRYENKRVLADWGDEFLFEGEDEHEATLEVGIRGASWVIARRAGIVLQSGQRVTLEPIDARERFRALQVVVRDREGRPIAGARLRLRDAFGEGFRSLETSPTGEIVNLVPSEVEVLYVSADGYEDAVVRLSTTPVELTLHPKDG